MNTVDLSQRPPRSPRLKLGGYVLLPRMLDKGRAHLAGKAGEYHFNCPLDQRLMEFTGLSADDILSLLKEGKSDSEVLAWIRANTKRTDFEIYQWTEVPAAEKSLGQRRQRIRMRNGKKSRCRS